MAGERAPNHKGTGLLPIVQALKANPVAAAKVPSDLRHYLEDAILVSGWYPEDDYHVLLQMLADATPAERVGGDVWRFFGRVAAQRDLAGQQDLVAARTRTHTAGVYKRFADGGGEGIASIFTRLPKLWALYHDSGTLTVHRSRTGNNVVLVRLARFRFPTRGIADLQVAYTTEFAHLVGYEVTGRLRRQSVADGGTYEWEYTCPATPECVESLARLPLEAE